MKRQGEVVFSQVHTSQIEAERQVAAGRSGAWKGKVARIYPRQVRANSVGLPVWIVIVREKAVQS